METRKQTGTAKREGKKSRGISSAIVIVVALILAESFFYFVLGSGSNFQDGNNANEPLPGNMLGTMFKGGFVVPIILTLLLTVIILSVERFFALGKAKGKGNLINFVYDVKADLRKGNISSAEAHCAKQKGSVAAIVDAGLKKYKEMETQDLAKETKIEEIKAEIEEATALELPSMQQNLAVIATISTLGTLMGLFGTVLGMIKSFAALGTAGAVDSVALSVGISEALVNTATGIATGALAIISYSYFSGKIDNMTYAIDEMGFALTQTYAETH
ncbi:MAG: MotA/TolQ/ExbB proton channel family protein [Dysgonamonadaceae bacterium]|jgi:biopolymer transport protein ExbB|nr:MotA/TolQ/ExbB proton channel family protein [Dysgonamonadaceae bacterium]